MTAKDTNIAVGLARSSQCEQTLANARAEGLPEIVARILASRSLPPVDSLRRFLQPGLKDLDDPGVLADMNKAATRVADAVIGGEVIGLESDYDQDGLGAMATMYFAFTQVFEHPAEQLSIFVGHRLRDGYGLCDPIADRILDATPRAAVVITADNGSSDERRIERLARAGIDVIVTDHHALPVSGPPASAYACINPQRGDCDYPDGAIAGGMVAWLLMCVVHRRLVERDHIPDRRRQLGLLLDFVACSTVADCVSLASVNNRAIVRHGLRLMNERPRACWQGMRPLLKSKTITAETIAFGIAPRVNAQTRLNSADEALRFLLAGDKDAAREAAAILDANNEERKEIERAMVDDAIALADEQLKQGHTGIVTFLENGHPGVQGICSSRIVERYGRPAFTFCPNLEEPNLLTGSGRSIGPVHLRDVLQEMADAYPDLFEKFGGHSAAAGVTIAKDRLPDFVAGFDEALQSRVDSDALKPSLASDGELTAEELSLDTVDALTALEPTGRGFAAAQFDGEFEVTAVRPVGDRTHLKLALRYQNRHLSAIWFRAVRSANEPWPVQRGERARLVYRLADNNGYGPRRLELIIAGKVSDAA